MNLVTGVTGSVCTVTSPGRGFFEDSFENFLDFDSGSETTVMSDIEFGSEDADDGDGGCESEVEDEERR